MKKTQIRKTLTRMKKAICFVMVLAFAIALLPTLYQKTTAAGGTPVSTETELKTAITAALSGEVIELTQDIITTDSVTIPAGKNITLTSDMDAAGAPFKIDANGGDFSVIVIALGGAELTLKNIVITGANKRTISGGIRPDPGGGVYVYVGGTLNMYEGAEISGNKVFQTTGGSDNGNGGGVYSRGELNLYPGAIITGNETCAGGGVMCGPDGTFNMYGGTIYDNSAKYTGGGVWISSNMQFNMNGGTISGNSAQGGGGAYISGGTFNMSDQAIISGNESTGEGNSSAKGGGGVLLEGGSIFNMLGGSIIGNIAYNGGGVLSTSNNIYSVTFNMSGGLISGNTAKVDGGGVYNAAGVAMPFDNVGTNAWFNMTGGEISGNTATSAGGGIYNKYSTAVVNTSGTAAIIGNSANVGGG